MGKGSYGQLELRGDLSDVYVGNYCSIAQGVRIDTGWHHNYRFATTYPFNAFFDKAKHIDTHPVTKGDVFIGNDVWIGEGAIIMGGITILDGAVIGAGAVVTKNVAAYSIVAGNPAREIKKRFSQDIIQRLMLTMWWDWPEEKILENVELLMNENIEEFLNKHGK